MFDDLVDVRANSDGTATLFFTDTKKTCTIDLSDLTPREKVARIRDQILREGYFYSARIEKKIKKKFGQK